MSGSVVSLVYFGCGVVGGVLFGALPDADALSRVILYALMLQVGISIGRNQNLRAMLHAVGPRLLLLPVFTLAGTLLLSAACALVLSRWSVAQCLAVGSGMGYYSLSSVLIAQLQAPSIGVQMASELGTIALLSNILREMAALCGAPLLRRFFGRAAPIAVAGATSADVTLPAIVRASGGGVVAASVFHGLVLDFSVPFWVGLFCG